MKKENEKVIFPEVVVGELPLLTKEILSNKQQTPDKNPRGKSLMNVRQSLTYCGMTNAANGFTASLVTPQECSAGYSEAKRGFTLIELLVVVLIIGILTAVALPQYQKAVEKSKAAQAVTLLKSVYQAAKVYKIENGSWPTSLDQIDIEIPWTGTDRWATDSAGSAGKSNGDWSIQLATGGDYGYGVIVGRISGPYAGAAFAITDTARTNNTHGIEAPNEEIICIEGKQGNSVIYSFAKNEGAYCKKLFHATFVPTEHTSNYFTLP